MVLKIGLPAGSAYSVTAYIKRKIKYKGGTKAANTHLSEVWIYTRPEKALYITFHMFWSSVLLQVWFHRLFLLQDLQKRKQLVTVPRRRDIFLCMDVSYSIYELNADLVESLEEVVEGLDGDRFGICIYNTSTVLYVPMTDDYDFVISKLEELKEYFVLQKEFMDKYYNPIHRIYMIMIMTMTEDSRNCRRSWIIMMPELW